MVRKHNIVQNVDLTDQKIIVLLNTEQAMQTEANSNTIANVTLPLDLHFSIFPSGLRDCSLGSVTGHSHCYSDHQFGAPGRLCLEVQMPMAVVSLWKSLALSSFVQHVTEYTRIFCIQNKLIWHWQSVDQNSDQTVWTSKAVEINKRWFTPLFHQSNL